MKATPTQIRYIITAIIIFLLASAIFNFSGPLFGAPPKDVTLTEFIAEVQKDNVSEVNVDSSTLAATLKNGDKIKTFKEATANLSDYGIKPEKVAIKVKNPDSGAFWPTFFSVVLPFLLLGVFVYFIFRQAQGANSKAMTFGKSSAKLANLKNKITFKDVAGLVEAKQELFEIVEFLRSPEKFKALGAEIPKGVLLFGPPGVGKTMLAKAVAGEAGVPFFTISASEFVEMFVGVGASRVRDLFQKAKRNAPTVIFIDELDAIGRMRGSGLGGSHDEREQTLNQILVEMDGFDTDTRVIVLAATNRPDVLDPALMRPGRFDRRVVLTLPDKKERVEILKIHSRNKPIEKDVDFGAIASGTPGLSGADLRNVVNEAAIIAARANQRTITQADLHEAIEKVLLGPERKSRILSDKETRITAYHEAGHALVGRILKPAEPIRKISIISRGMALGYTWSLPDEDRYIRSQEDFESDIAMLLGGRVAEKVMFNQLTTGASSDLDKASKIARDMVQVYGMSDKIGPVTLGQRDELVFLGKELGQHKNYSEKVAALVDDEVERIVSDAQKKTEVIIKKNKTKLEKIAELLLKKETIGKEELEKII